MPSAAYLCEGVLAWFLKVLGNLQTVFGCCYRENMLLSKKKKKKREIAGMSFKATTSRQKANRKAQVPSSHRLAPVCLYQQSLTYSWRKEQKCSYSIKEQSIEEWIYGSKRNKLSDWKECYLLHKKGKMRYAYVIYTIQTHTFKCMYLYKPVYVTSIYFMLIDQNI